MLISQSDLDAFRDALNTFSNDVDKTIITWKTNSVRKDNFGEEIDQSKTRQLNCTLAYNYFRTWPINLQTEGGKVDKENLVVILNYDYLDGLGYIVNGTMPIDRGSDVFIIEGIEYSVYGDTNVSQAGDLPISVYLILQRNPK